MLETLGNYINCHLYIAILITWLIKGASPSPPPLLSLLHCRFQGAVKITLLVISLFGFLTFDALYMFSILNYVAQGEMNIYLLWDIRRLIEIRKYDHIDGAIKVGGCRGMLVRTPL